MGELLNLQNYLSSVRDDLIKNDQCSFASNVTVAIGILMDYRNDRPLNNRSIKKLVSYAGTLNLLLTEAQKLADCIDKAIDSVDDTKWQEKEDHQLEKDLSDIAFTIGELILAHPQMNNDLDFFKTIYNRQLDKNPKRKE